MKKFVITLAILMFSLMLKAQNVATIYLTFKLTANSTKIERLNKYNTIQYYKKLGWKPVNSYRSGLTNIVVLTYTTK